MKIITWIGNFVKNALTVSGKLFVDQNSDEIALDIDSEATTGSKFALNVITGQGARVAKLAYDTNEFFQINVPTDSVGSSWFYRNKTSADTNGPLVFLEQDNSADDQSVLTIQQDAAANCIKLEPMNDANHAIIRADSPAGSANDFELKWNTSIDRFTLILGNGTNNYRIWVDNTGDLRIHTADPTAHDDGTIVGTQS